VKDKKVIMVEVGFVTDLIILDHVSQEVNLDNV
jgi:hypothetical protein